MKRPHNLPRGIQIGDYLRLTDEAVKDGCTSLALGADRARLVEINDDGLLRVLVDGQTEPITHHPAYWEAYRGGGQRANPT